MAWTKTSDADNSAQDNSTPVGSITVTIPTINAGDILWILVRWSTQTPVISTVSDGTNTYQIKLKTSDATNGAASCMCYAINAQAATNKVVTVTFDSNVTFSYAYGSSWSGGDTVTGFDVQSGQFQHLAGTGSNAVSSTAATTTKDGGLILGSAFNDIGSGTCTVGSSPNVFTQDKKYTVAGADIDTEENFKQTTAASIAATYTAGSNTDWLTQMMAFMPPQGSAKVSVDYINFPKQKIRLSVGASS